MSAKAWKVTEPNEGYAEIVFATSRGRAKLVSRYYDGDFLALDVRRAPDFDEFAPQGRVPKEALLAKGWWWTCYKCNERVTEENGSVINNKVYCEDCSVGGGTP